LEFSFINKLFGAISLTLLMLLSACNGSSGDNENPDNESPVASNIVITLFDEQGNIEQSFNADKVVTVQVKVTSSSNNAIANKRVNVTTDLG